MGHFDGWRDAAPEAVRDVLERAGRGSWPPKRLSRGARMHAVPTVVFADFTMMPADQAKDAGLTGVRFHSKKEAEVYVSLKMQERAGLLHDLQRQVPFALHAPAKNGGKVLIGTYRADFTFYDDGKTGPLHVIDVKGQPRREDLYLWKRRHLEAEYGLTLEEY